MKLNALTKNDAKADKRNIARDARTMRSTNATSLSPCISEVIEMPTNKGELTEKEVDEIQRGNGEVGICVMSQAETPCPKCKQSRAKVTYITQDNRRYRTYECRSAVCGYIEER